MIRPLTGHRNVDRRHSHGEAGQAHRDQGAHRRTGQPRRRRLESPRSRLDGRRYPRRPDRSRAGDAGAWRRRGRRGTLDSSQSSWRTLRQPLGGLLCKLSEGPYPMPLTRCEPKSPDLPRVPWPRLPDEVPEAARLLQSDPDLLADARAGAGNTLAGSLLARPIGTIGSRQVAEQAVADAVRVLDEGRSED